LNHNKSIFNIYILPNRKKYGTTHRTHPRQEAKNQSQYGLQPDAAEIAKCIQNETSNQIMELRMTTKILTIRVPVPIYSTLCTSAAELGVPVSAHVRRLIEQEHQAEQLALLRNELLAKLDRLIPMEQVNPAPSQAFNETLLLIRAIAAHLNPQLVAQVRAKLAIQQQGALV
jgi:hypothetical protein